MLSPKRTKFKKQHRGRMTSKAARNTTISFGEYALQAQEPGWITSRQIEATRRTLTHALKREGKLWVKIFPDKPITARSAESRMGSGKGSVEFWVAVVKPNTLLFEVGEITKSKAQQAMKLAAYKLPVKTKFLTKF